MESSKQQQVQVSIIGIFMASWMSGLMAFADNTTSRKQELQEKIVQCFPHGIPSHNIKDLSESDIPLLIELSEDPANARCRYNAFVALSHIQSKKSHDYLEAFYLKHVFTLHQPISNKCSASR